MKEKAEQTVRTHFVKTRMNDRELAQLTTLQKRTTEKDLSSYLRKVALQKPVILTYRNRSADDFLAEMLGLKKELAFVSKNFSEAVDRLRLLERIPEFRIWLTRYDATQHLLIDKVEEIRTRTAQLYELWLQK